MRARARGVVDGCAPSTSARRAPSTSCGLPPLARSTANVSGSGCLRAWRSSAAAVPRPPGLLHRGPIQSGLSMIRSRVSSRAGWAASGATKRTAAANGSWTLAGSGKAGQRTSERAGRYGPNVLLSGWEKGPNGSRGDRCPAHIPVPGSFRIVRGTLCIIGARCQPRPVTRAYRLATTPAVRRMNGGRGAVSAARSRTIPVAAAFPSGPCKRRTKPAPAGYLRVHGRPR